MDVFAAVPDGAGMLPGASVSNKSNGHHLTQLDDSPYSFPIQQQESRSGSPTAATRSMGLAVDTDGQSELKQLPSVDLSKELPLVMDDLIPLSFIVERIVSQAHADLLNLTETLPHSDDATRKRAIVDFVLQTRRQLLKVLVLTRWSSEAFKISKCMNIVGFLSRQNYEFDRTVEALTEVRTMLAGARVRNYDISTALSILTTGQYTRLPSSIKETFASEEKLGDETVLRTLREMDDVLRWRLCCIEVVPRPMGKWTIADGRATFRIEGKWEASFTYSGGNDDPMAEWYLLSVKFLFTARDSRGLWSSVPIGPMKQQIVALCNQELAKRKPPEAAADEGADISVQDGEEHLPLVKAYNFLQRLTLNYQLETLYSQATRLQSTSWSGNLTVEIAKDRKQLKIGYWSVSAPQVQPQSVPGRNTSAAPDSPSSRGFLTISLPSIAECTNRKSKVLGAADNRDSSQRRLEALDTVLGWVDSLDRKPTTLDVVADPCLEVKWSADVADSIRAMVSFQINWDVDFESLLLRAVSIHARESVVALYRQFINDLGPKDIELVMPDGTHLLPDSLPPPSSVSLSSQVPYIQVHLHSQRYILTTISHQSGKLEFKALGEVPAQREIRLRNASEKVDKDRTSASETLLRVRASTILDEVDSRASYLGLTTSRRLPLRTSDLTRFGSTNRSFLFIHLQELPLYYLTLCLLEEGFRFALISVKEGSDSMQTWLALQEIGWLDKACTTTSHGPIRMEADKPAPYSSNLELEDLRDLYEFSVRRIASFKIEQKFHSRRIPFRHVGYPKKKTGTSPLDTSLLSERLPYLVVKSNDLLRAIDSVAYPNIAILCTLQGDLIESVFHVRFRDLASLDFRRFVLPDLMRLDEQTSTATFIFHDLDNCVETFLSAYSIITRAIVLAHHESAETAKRMAIKNDAVES